MDIFPGGWKSSKGFFFLFVFLLRKREVRGLCYRDELDETSGCVWWKGDMEEKFLLLYITGFASVRRWAFEIVRNFYSCAMEQNVGRD